jgi:hypothetical protein
VPGSNPLAPTNYINFLRLPLKMAVLVCGRIVAESPLETLTPCIAAHLSSIGSVRVAPCHLWISVAHDVGNSCFIKGHLSPT